MRRAALLLLLVTLGATRPAFADAPDDPRARAFFAVGVQAYGKGQYPMAIESFQQAYAIAPRPGLLFSLAQAHQKQFRAGADEKHLQAALDYYRKYLAADPNGNRRGEALTAIQALSTVAAQLHPSGSSGVSSPVFGKLLIASPTPGIAVTLNGDSIDALPATLELPPGAYTLLASAPGYRSEQRELRISPGLAVPVSLELTPLPARVLVHGPSGAEAFVDGRPIGFLPLSALALPAGEHWLSVRQPGRQTRNVKLALTRGDDARLAFDLETTTQRRIAWAVGVGGAASLVATGVFAGMAWHQDAKASDLDPQKQPNQQLSPQQGQALNAAVDDRDRFRSYAIGTGITSAALLALAVVLYVSDTPDPPKQPERSAQLARTLERASLTFHF